MDTKRLNAILIRRRGLVLVPSSGSDGRTPKAVVASFNLNLQDLGYTLTPRVIGRLSKLPEDECVRFLDGTMDTLKELKGVRSYRPMYPNFPQQVIDASDAELYINAILHYFSTFVADATGDKGCVWLPKYRKDRREPLDEKVQLRVISLGDGTEPMELGRQLATSNASLSDTDKEDLRFLFAEFFDALPEGIPNKENLAFLGGVLFSKGAADFGPYFRTATDVLRLAVALSGGDVSLAEPCLFRKFRREERRRLLALLDQCGNLGEDLLRWEGRWLRLGEKLHPGDYFQRYYQAFKAINDLRNGTSPQTFRSKVEEAVRSGHVKDAVRLLKDRPGEFGRRLDHILRKARTKAARAEAVHAFLAHAGTASTPVLLQMMAHFDHRSEGGERTVFPKGSIAKVQTIPALPEMDKALSRTASLGIRRVLRRRFSALPPLGKVYLDPGLKDFLLPFSQRSASKSLRTLVRGSRAPFGFGDKNTVRLFIWWKDTKGPVADEEAGNSPDLLSYRWNYDTRVDLDLSAVFYDSEWREKGEVTYYQLRCGRGNGFSWHSGDITSAPKGASEFIDIDIGKALAHGVRYVLMSVNGYTQQNFCDLPECYAGWMLRGSPQSGEVYDPRTVEDKADLTMKARAGIPLIADLAERKVIWCDCVMPVRRGYNVNVYNNRSTIQTLATALTNVAKASVYDLLLLHAKARGTLVATPEEADTVFSVRTGTQYELERLASEFMADAPKAKKAPLKEAA